MPGSTAQINRLFSEVLSEVADLPRGVVNLFSETGSEGSVAGLMLGATFAAEADHTLSQAAWIMQQQAKDKIYARTMPPLSITTATSLVGAAVLSSGHARRWFAAGAALAVASNLLTLKLEVPLNKTISSWDPEAPPPIWEDARKQWFSNHILRSVPAILAFGCAVVSLSRRGGRCCLL